LYHTRYPFFDFIFFTSSSKTYLPTLYITSSSHHTLLCLRVFFGSAKSYQLAALKHFIIIISFLTSRGGWGAGSCYSVPLLLFSFRLGLFCLGGYPYFCFHLFHLRGIVTLSLLLSAYADLPLSLSAVFPLSSMLTERRHLYINFLCFFGFFGRYFWVFFWFWVVGVALLAREEEVHTYILRGYL